MTVNTFLIKGLEMAFDMEPSGQLHFKIGFKSATIRATQKDEIIRREGVKKAYLRYIPFSLLKKKWAFIWCCTILSSNAMRLLQ